MFLSNEHEQRRPVAASLRQSRQGSAEGHKLLAQEASLQKQSFELPPRILMARIIQEPAPVLPDETAQPMKGNLHSTHGRIAIGDRDQQ